MTSRDSRSASDFASSASSRRPSTNPPFSTKVGNFLAAVVTLFAAATGSSCTNATALGPSSRLPSSAASVCSSGAPHQGVLDDREAGAPLREGSAELGDLGHREAAVLGEQQGRGAFDLLLQLRDPLDLLGLGIAPPRMNNASPQTAETRDGASPDGTRVRHADRRLGRYPSGITRSRAPAVCGSPRIAGDRARSGEARLGYRSAGSVCTPRGLDASIRTLGPIVDETASVLM